MAQSHNPEAAEQHTAKVIGVPQAVDACLQIFSQPPATRMRERHSRSLSTGSGVEAFRVIGG